MSIYQLRCPWGNVPKKAKQMQDRSLMRFLDFDNVTRCIGACLLNICLGVQCTGLIIDQFARTLTIDAYSFISCSSSVYFQSGSIFTSGKITAKATLHNTFKIQRITVRYGQLHHFHYYIIYWSHAYFLYTTSREYNSHRKKVISSWQVRVSPTCFCTYRGPPRNNRISIGIIGFFFTTKSTVDWIFISSIPVLSTYISIVKALCKQWFLQKIF